MSPATVLVVGGASGIGRAVVAELSGDYEVETLSRRAVGVEGFVHHSADASDPAQVAAVLEGHAPFDHLVVTAATTPTGSLAQLSDEQARTAVQNKFWLSYTLARDVAWTRSLTLTSGYLSARPGQASALQSAINAGIEGLARAIARELAPARVNCVSPGTVDSGLWDALPAHRREAVLRGASERSLLGRPGTPADVARAVRFAIECEYLTGETVFVDGGARWGGA
ncbi:MAG: hypothetical protein QG608_1112 [Actinomycetota bacterium]|nr:hypothetical protein [Actinomycetota bacterium]